MDLVTRVQILGVVVCVLLYINAIEKGMNPLGLRPAMSK